MTMTNTSDRVSFTGDGSTTEFPYTFPVVNTTDIVVIARTIATGAESTLTITTDYTATAGASGGTVTTVSTYTSATEIHIIRVTPKTQQTDLVSAGASLMERIEEMGDKLTRLLVESYENYKRAVRTPLTDDELDALPNEIDRAESYLYFDASGQPQAATPVEGALTITSQWETRVGSDLAADLVAFLDAADNAGAKSLLFLDHVYDVREYGAKADRITATNGVAVATDATFTSATMSWVAADIGKVICITGAGAAGIELVTTIASINSTTSIELTDVAATSVNPATFAYGTDNEAAVDLAIEAAKTAGEGLVLFPPGDYQFADSSAANYTGQVRLDASNLTVMGYGATLHTPEEYHTTGFLMILGESGTFIENVTVLGLGIDMHQTAIDAVEYCQCIVTGYCNNVTLRDLRIANAGFTGIGISYGGQGIHVDNCRVSDCAGDSIHIGDQVAPATISDVWVTNCLLTDALDNALACTGNSSRIFFLNNVCDSPSTSGIDFAGVYDSVAKGNKIFGYGQHGIRAYDNSGESYNLTIRDNDIAEPGNGYYCIYLGSANKDTAGSFQSVTGNLMRLPVTGTASYGVFVQGTHDAIIKNNVILGSDNSQYGIVLSGVAGNPNTDCVYSDNVFINLARGISAADDTYELTPTIENNVNLGSTAMQVGVTALDNATFLQAGVASTKTYVTTVDIPATEIKDLVATPKELVAAQGAGTLIEVLSCVLFLDYGSEVLAEPSAPDDLALEYDDGSGEQITTWDTTGFITSSADAMEIVVCGSLGGGASAITTAANVNKNVVLINTGTDYTGNASDDTAIRAVTTYRVYDKLGL